MFLFGDNIPGRSLMRGTTSAPLHKHSCPPVQACRNAASLEKKAKLVSDTRIQKRTV